MNCTVVLYYGVFSLRNPDELIDPIEDFTSGKSIYLPSKESVDRVTG